MGYSRRQRRLVPMVVGLVLAVGGAVLLDWYSTRSAEPAKRYLKGTYYWQLGSAHQLVPPKTYRITWADKQACPVGDFGFIIRTERGFAVDTIAGTITKDMISQPDTTVVLRLDRATMRALRDLYLRTRLSELPEPAPPYGSEAWIDRAHGLGVVEVEIHCGGTIKRFTWHTGHAFGGRYLEEWRRLWWFAGSAFEAAISSPEFRALPPGKGGYI